MLALIRIGHCVVAGVVLGLTTCGGQTSITAPEASGDVPPTDTVQPEPEPHPPERADSSVEASQSSRQPGRIGPASDAEPRDAGRKVKYTLFDGGRDCEGVKKASGDELRTCCNGALCKGQCLLAEGAKTPVCLCAGFEGGCPSDWVCCFGGCEPNCGVIGR